MLVNIFMLFLFHEVYMSFVNNNNPNPQSMLQKDTTGEKLPCVENVQEAKMLKAAAWQHLFDA